MTLIFKIGQGVVLATGPVTRQRSGFWLAVQFCLVPDPAKNPTRFVLAGLLPGPVTNLWSFGQVQHTAEPYFCDLRTLPAIKYLSSDRITIRYIRKRCTFACSFTSYSPLCDPINICRVAVKWRRKLGVFRSDATNINWIAKWRIGGERACKTASFTYISYCDTIRTQIPNWSQSSESAKLWNRPKNRGFGAVQFFDAVKPNATVPVRFQPGPGYEPQIWNRC